MNQSCLAYEYIMSHAWMSAQCSHGLSLLPVRVCANESCHVYEWDELYHVIFMNESCPTYEYVMSHTWISARSSYELHPTLLVCACEWVVSRVRMRWIASCHIYEWVMSHVWTRHISHMNECAVYSWIASSSFSVSRVTCTNEMSCVMSYL